MIFINALSWYLIITLAGWVVFPLAYRLLAFLPDRGLALTRPLGLLLWGYTYWMLVSLRVLQNDAGGSLFALLIVAAFSILALRGTGWREIRAWLQAKKRLVTAGEGVFLAAFAAWVVIRAAMPDASGTEKPMELAFINSLLRSPAFPPSDPWLSGYAISYYYFGYVMVAMLARLAGVSGAVAFNLALASWFAMTALAAFGLLVNLLSLRRPNIIVNPLSGLLAPFFVLVAGNLEGFLEMLHARGIFWTQTAGGTWQSSFWSWLDIQELTQPPTLPLGWAPERLTGIWWWRASRVLQDYALDRSSREVIDEFPMFSYLLGDLHPHLLAMPFALLAVGLALNIFLQARSNSAGRVDLWAWVKGPGFWLVALAMGGLAFLNTWDFPIYVALFAAAAVLNAFLRGGLRFDLGLDFLVIGFGLGLAGVGLYLPFYLSFASQANGILPSLIFFTRGAHFWIMFGVLLLPIAVWLLWNWRRRGSLNALAQGGIFAVLVIAGLWLASILFGLLRLRSNPALAATWGAKDGQTLIVSSVVERLGSPSAWITLLGLLALGWGLLQALRRMNEGPGALDDPARPENHPGSAGPFVLLVFLVGLALVVFPEFFYLRDQFGYRMNTIFKFYFQAWVLWGIAAGYASAVLLGELRGLSRGVFSAAWALLILVALPYPVYGLLTRTNQFNPAEWTLDGAAYIERYNPDEMEAIRWLQQAPYGVVAEAVGGSYTGYARVSTHSGLPTVLGWPGHELQWRGGGKEIGSRESDIASLYQSRDWTQASAVIEKYFIRYIYVGDTERRDFRFDEILFREHLPVVFQNNSVTIYEVQSSDTQQVQASRP